MKLNETIRRLRRAKGLTQEQVAQALGVSGPAVNKWERGACCPDLALLAPLARLLDTDLNTLLSFREELTGAEIAAFTEELYTLAQSRGIDAAFLRAEELLHRWPGCDRLTISLAMTLNGLFFTLGVAEPEPYERRLEPLYRALADSEEPDIRDQALHLLIGRHMRREEYAAAEELLSSLSDRWPHRDALQAGLLRRTGRGEEAAELWERRLLNAATEVYESLVSLQELALQAERLEDGARLAALIEETAERYALIPGVASSGRLQQAAAEGDKTAALSALRDMLEALNRSWDGGGLYPHLLPGTQVAVGSVLLPGLLLELQQQAGQQNGPDGHLRTGQKVGIEPPAVPGAVERLQHIPQGRQGGRLVPLCRGLLEPSGGGDAGNEGVTLRRLLNEGGQPGPVLQPLRLEGQLLKADQ